MTPTAMTEGSEAPAAGLAGLVGPVSGRQAERLQAQLVAAEMKRQDRDAEENRRQARLDAEEKRRQDRARERDERRAERRRDRAEARSALGQALAERSVNLMIAPLIAVPGWLGWDAMSGFGVELYGSPGHALPVLSETGMWLFDFAVIRARRKAPGAVVWPLYAGMAVFAGICASLNFMHGLLGPIPGSIPPGAEAGLVYALISISGIIAHQIAEFGGRKKAAGETAVGETAVGAEVAPQGEKVAPAGEGGTNAAATATKGATSGGGAGVSGPATSRADGPATTAERDRAVAARDRLAGENAALRQQLADARRGNPGNDESDRDDDTEKPARRGDYKAVMRACWEKEIAAGNIPNGADLNRAARKEPDSSLGRRYASEWRNELPGEFIGQTTGNQQRATVREESSSTVLAGVAR